MIAHPNLAPVAGPRRWGILGFTADCEVHGGMGEQVRSDEPLDIDHGLLLALDALLRERNVTRAAIRLGIGQSSLSARLARLRKSLADPLFVPAANGRGVVPTPRALELQSELAELLARINRLVDGGDRFIPEGSSRSFCIAAHENPAVVLASGLVSRVAAAAPGVRIAFVHPSPNPVAQLESGEADILVSGALDGTGDLIRKRLLQDDFLTAQRKGHPRGRGQLDIETFCTLNHLLVSTDGGAFAGVVDQALAKLGRTRRVTVSIQSYALAPVILAGSDCVCTLPSTFLSNFSDALDFSPPPLVLPPTTLTAYWHRRSHHDAGHVWLREHLYELAHAARQ